MKKAFLILMSVLLLTGLFAGCGKSPAAPDGGGKIKIVATIFPAYDWVKQIMGDRADKAELTLLLDSGVDLHSYQPTAEDMIKISSCDLFIYVGGESDEWVHDALEQAANGDMKVINMMEELGGSVKEEEVKEGMEQDHDHDHDHDHDQDHDHDHEEDREGGEDETEYDEHVWLSLRNAGLICEKTAQALSAIDPDGKAAYEGNLRAYAEKLDELDARYAEAAAAGRVKTLLFGDRFPFRYLTDDYSLDYYAAFVGCSAETEASFETVAFLAGKTDELGLSAVLKIENSDGKIAATIVENTASKDQRILTMDSMQSATLSDAENGTGYLSVMESNLEVLKQALS